MLRVLLVIVVELCFVAALAGAIANLVAPMWTRRTFQEAKRKLAARREQRWEDRTIGYLKTVVDADDIRRQLRENFSRSTMNFLVRHSSSGGWAVSIRPRTALPVFVALFMDQARRHIPYRGAANEYDRLAYETAICRLAERLLNRYLNEVLTEGYRAMLAIA